MTATAEFRLTQAQYDALWSELDLDRKPCPVDLPAVTRTERARALLEFDPDSREQLDGLLRLLSRHVTAVDAVADVQGPVRALAATDGVRAVLAVVDSNEIILTAIRPTALATAVLSVLPPARAGTGHGFSVPLEALLQAAELCDEDSWHDERDALTTAGVPETDAAVLNDLATGRTAGGQFGVTQDGTRSPVLITWFDTRNGRYFMVRDGAWLSIAPADEPRIATRIDALLSAA